MNSIIASNLSKIRIMNNLSKSQMAEIMGITRQTYNKIEQGAGIKCDSVAKLSIKLGISLDELLLDQYKLKSSTNKQNKNNSSIQQLFIDFIDCEGDPNIIKKEIVHKTLNKTILKKPFAMKVLKLQNNRLIVELITILTNIKKETNFNKIPRSKAKDILEETIKKHKANLFSGMVKKSLLKKLDVLSSADCYYLITYSDIATQILSDSINKFDKQTIRYLGCEVLKD